MNATPDKSASPNNANPADLYGSLTQHTDGRDGSPRVMFSIPRVTVRTKESQSYATVPLVVPDSSRLQTLVQNARQGFLNLAGGSRFWRLFVGGGVAVFVGALTLIVLGPAPEQHPSGESSPASQAAPPKASSASPQPQRVDQRSQIELTVNESEGITGPQPAEFDDPFVEKNLVTAKAQHAVHYSDVDQGVKGNTILQVSHGPQQDESPAWLSGTIDATDEPSPQPMRNHERSRPSHR